MDSLKNDTSGQEYVEFSKALESETVEGLLGKPAWRHEALPEARFTILAQFEGALSDWGRVIQQHHVEHDFNMFGDYLKFYRDYVANTKKNPIDFFRDYEAKINTKHMNCTGLNKTLLHSLKESDPAFGSYFALISSEEMQVDANSAKKYEFGCANVVKRHVLICLKFSLSLSMGDRKGCVLADSGYSLTMPIVVMRDSVYPHTGWFVAWRRDKIEQRNYKFVNDRFVQYEHRYISQSTGEIHLKSNIINLIYVEREYLSYECHSLKQSLRMNIKFWDIRSEAGPVAAFYIDKRNLTILYKQTNLQTTVKHDFSIGQLDSEEVLNALRKVAEWSVRARSAVNDRSSNETIEHNFQAYLQTLREYREILNDERFTAAIHSMDEWILSKQQKIECFS